MRAPLRAGFIVVLLLASIDFTDNLVINGPGVDLVLFELARPEDFSASLSISGISIFVPTSQDAVDRMGLD